MLGVEVMVTTTVAPSLVLVDKMRLGEEVLGALVVSLAAVLVLVAEVMVVVVEDEEEEEGEGEEEEEEEDCDTVELDEDRAEDEVEESEDEEVEVSLVEVVDVLEVVDVDEEVVVEVVAVVGDRLALVDVSVEDAVSGLCDGQEGTPRNDGMYLQKIGKRVLDEIGMNEGMRRVRW